MKNFSIETFLKLICCFTLSLCISLTSSLSSDALALLALKAAISEDPRNAVVSWSDSDSSPCSWAGIICDAARGRVTSVSLSGKNLKGYVPSEIGALSSLAFLDLSQNSFSGPLPQQITNLRGLVHLDISSNNFSGSLPEGLGDLGNLRGTLNLSCNSFSGEIPASLGRLPMAVSLDLRRNNLTGEIPQVGSLLNQGPTAFSGNPFLCGFPSNTLCAEARTPNFSDPQKPGISSNGLSAKGKMKSGMVTVSVICGVSAAAMGMMFVSVWLMKRRCKMEEKMGRENASLENGGREKGQKGKFVVVDEGFGLELEDLLRASAYVLGKSRSGIVYKVVVSGGKGAAPVAAAVRRLSEGEAAWRLKEFEAEAEAIAKVQHPNIVRLRAYYYANDEKLLISDFIGNGSLHNALHGTMSGIPPLTWAARLRIAQEAARALTHIHECSSGGKKHIHGGVKTSKILLDHDLKPYISGFGLPRLVAGAPRSSTQKCDVYAFGVVLVEILTGRVQGRGAEGGVEGLVRRVFREERPLSEIIDPSLRHEGRAKKQIVAMFHIALSCTEMEPQLRPKMRMVSYNLDCIKLE